MKHIIIGGVAGGATAAARIRRADEFAEIILLEKGNYISYANCGLPYYLGGVIRDRDKLFVQSASFFGHRFGVDVRTQNEAIGIDTDKKCVTICRADGSHYIETYDKLLLSPGASAVKPPLKGIESKGIFTLRNVHDTDLIKKHIIYHPPKHAVVVGAGFIGLEMAENLHAIGAQVSIIEMGEQVMAPVDYSIASHVHQHLLQKGVDLHLKQRVEAFEQHDNKIRVLLNNGQQIETDLVILSIGVRPETRLAKAAGLRLGETGGIWVNEYLETSATDVYAVGDAIEFPHPLTGKPWLNFLANPANRQGRIVADNMVWSNTTQYEGAIGTSIAKVFDLTVASTGLAAKKLTQLGIAHQSSTTHSVSHASYYPGALPLTLKLTFDPQTGQLYGAQCLGYEGVDKRIDQLALVIKNRGTVLDLTQVEHAYAPPFSSAKDPIAIAGYVATNIVHGAMPIISWRKLAENDHTDALIIDVRTQEEYAFGAIAGAVNIPLDELRDRLSEIPQEKTIFLYCAVGLRGYLALKTLTAHGYKQVYNLSGGYKTYSTATAPLTQEDGSTTNNINVIETQQMEHPKKKLKIDASGLQCPGPILKLKQAMDSLSVGQQVEIISTDAGFSRDAQAWCNSTGNILIDNKKEKWQHTVTIEKGGNKSCNIVTSCDEKGKTFILFSDDLDKALATFVLANGAAATGHKVTIFYTFWGLNVIKKRDKPKVEKDIFAKMFGFMLPSHSLQLHLSKMSMLGIGDKMMRHIMRQKGIDSLESLRTQAIENGVEFIACQMSMDVMGVKQEELMDNVTIGGVATYMERAENANVNLFI